MEIIFGNDAWSSAFALITNSNPPEASHLQTALLLVRNPFFADSACFVPSTPEALHPLMTFDHTLTCPTRHSVSHFELPVMTKSEDLHILIRKRTTKPSSF